MDSFISLLNQGAVLRLLIIIIVSTIGFIGMLYWSASNRAKRRQAKEAGLPPPPGVFNQTWRFLMGLLNNLFGSNNNEPNDSDDNDMPEVNLVDNAANDLPMPTLDFPMSAPSSTSPQTTASDEDIDNFLSGLSEPEPPAAVQYPSAVIAPNDLPDTGELSYTPVEIGVEPERQGMVYVPRSGQLPEDAVEVMRIWRDINDGSLIIQMGDMLFQTMDEMRDRGMAKRFIAVVQNLAQIATIGAQAAGLPKPNFEATSTMFSAPGAWSATPAAPSPPPVAPTPAAPPTAPPAKDMPVTGSLGIVSQINRYLQKRLEQTPVFAGRKIKMTSAYDGTLEIWVDNHVFGNVGEIRDREVREFIQRILTEWENSH